MTEMPTPGRIVLYRTDGRNGLVYDLPAIVTVTPGSHPGDYPDGSRNPLPVPSGRHVHLTVFTPGGFGTTLEAAGGTHDGPVNRPDPDDFPGSFGLNPGSGTYVEWDVPPGDAVDPAPRTWRWPR